MKRFWDGRAMPEKSMLSKVLGEAICLLEAGADQPRILDLPYDFGEPFH